MSGRQAAILLGCILCGVQYRMGQAERMRHALCSETMVLNDTPRLVTGSYGGTSWVPGTPSDPENLIRIADSALYMAKNQGRNKVVVLPNK